MAQDGNKKPNQMSFFIILIDSHFDRWICLHTNRICNHSLLLHHLRRLLADSFKEEGQGKETQIQTARISIYARGTRKATGTKKAKGIGEAAGTGKASSNYGPTFSNATIKAILPAATTTSASI